MLADWMVDGTPARYLEEHVTAPATTADAQAAMASGAPPGDDNGVRLSDQLLVDVNRYAGAGSTAVSKADAMAQVGRVYESRMTDHAMDEIRAMNV